MSEQSFFEPTVVAEWVYEPPQIQVAETYRSQVWIPLEDINTVPINTHFNTH